MPEHLTPHDKKDDSDDSEGKHKDEPERPSWQPESTTAPEVVPWWEEIEKLKPTTTQPDELPDYTEGRAQALREWSFGDKKDKDLEEDSDEEKKSAKPAQPEQQTTSVAEEEPASESTTETTEASTGSDETTPELPEEEIEAAKQIAAEELEQHEMADASEPDPVIDYLEKLYQEGDPVQAEQEVIADYELEDVQAQADVVVQGLEDLLEEAAQKVGDRQLSRAEFASLARELVPDIEETESDEIEAFAPEPSEPPEIPTLPKMPDTDKNEPIITTRVHGSRAAPIRPVMRKGGGATPPIPPSSGGGGGGGGGAGVPLPGPPGGNFGGNRLSTLANMAANSPDMLILRTGLSAAERAQLRRRMLTTTLLAILIAYYIGNKRGKAQKEAEMKPELEHEKKDNKKLRSDILATEQRLDALNRLKAEQDKELYEQGQREQLARKEAQAMAARERSSQHTFENLKAPGHMLRVQQERASMSQKSEELQEATAASISEESEITARHDMSRSLPAGERLSETAPVFGVESVASSSDQPSLEREQQERQLRADDSRPELTGRSPAEEAPTERVSVERAAQSLHRPEAAPASVGSIEPFDSGLEHEEAIEKHSPLAEAIRPEEPVYDTLGEQEHASRSTYDRPEIGSTKPGLEVPLSSGTPEFSDAAYIESGLEPGDFESSTRAETVAASNVASMSMPELGAAAQTMTVGGENLGRMFQEDRIDAAGLRRVAAEYARGGYPEQILAQEQQVMEMRHQSPEFLKSSPASAPGAAAGSQDGGGGGLFAQATPRTNTESDHLLPAYDHEQYPSDEPQHLLPAYDQETISKKHHRVIMAAASLIGLGTGIILGLLLI